MKRLLQRRHYRLFFKNISGPLEWNSTIGLVKVAIDDNAGKPEDKIKNVKSNYQQSCLLPQMHRFVPDFDFIHWLTIVEYKREQRDSVISAWRETVCMDKQRLHL